MSDTPERWIVDHICCGHEDLWPAYFRSWDEADLYRQAHMRDQGDGHERVGIIRHMPATGRYVESVSCG